ncbi:MAG: SDR family NAD(P)-dependent oxidoreductase, partial [Pseudomonadota bacterium]|nr:SDR family NAD(P)-dependent oxidoreductase [Pseudomonadota bacterium]
MWKKKYKRALITGATSGIGEAFVDVLPASTDLILTGRNAERLGALQERLAVGGRAVEIIEADLRSPTDRKKLISRSESLKTDLFVN